MKSLIFLICVWLTSGKSLAESTLKLPSNLKLCDLKSPTTERNECIRSSIEKFLSTPHENTEDFSFASFDPFTIDVATFNYQNSNLLGGTFTVKNIKTFGFSTCKIVRVKSNFTDTSMQLLVELSMPRVTQSGNYRSNFSLNAVRLISRGQYNVTLKDVSVKWYIKGMTEEVDGKQFMKIVRYDAIPDAKDMKFSVSGLFPDKELNAVANQFMNDNWKLLYREMIGESRKQWEPLFKKFGNEFFSQIPWTYLINYKN